MIPTYSLVGMGWNHEIWIDCCLGQIPKGKLLRSCKLRSQPMHPFAARCWTTLCHLLQVLRSSRGAFVDHDKHGVPASGVEETPPVHDQQDGCEWYEIEINRVKQYPKFCNRRTETGSQLVFVACHARLLSDSYKTSHWRQYPPNTTEVYSCDAPTCKTCCWILRGWEKSVISLFPWPLGRRHRHGWCSFADNENRYFESRGGKFDQVVFFGLQYFLKRYLQGKVPCFGELALVACHVCCSALVHASLCMSPIFWTISELFTFCDMLFKLLLLYIIRTI